MNIGILDIILVVIVLASALRCAFRGFIKEIMSMAALVLGFAASILLTNTASRFLEQWFGKTFWNPVIAFLVIFLVVYIVVKLIEGLLHAIFEKIHLDKLDKALGLLLGLVEGAIFGALILIVLRIQPLVDVDNLLNKSVIAQIVLPILPVADIANTVGKTLKIQ